MTAAPDVSRRALLLGAAAVLPLALAGCASRIDAAGLELRAATGTDPIVAAASPRAVQQLPYGTDSSQWGELHLPAGPRKDGVVVVIHGGFWLDSYGADLGTPLAADLAARGYAVWNLEYRRVGSGGGWPNTFQDIASGIDHLRVISTQHGIDLDKVVAIGHSAGGQLAAWAAGRGAAGQTDPVAAKRVPLTGVVSQAGVLDLVAAANDGLGGDATQEFLGGEPDAVPDRYRLASPQENLPTRVPIRCVHGTDDQNVPPSQSENYVAAAKKAGGDATLTTVFGDHFSLITTGTAAWEACVARTAELLAP
ncbi:acetyl esterase/lipase [Nakamurella sp. UYEF19]|uniref:alpha/beta hydrolase family protein n=1 Tax=Nakamurella sp. UYEF19 TaxID=1756392 RepID=UPI003390AB55